MSRARVLVIGAGPAGLAAACHLTTRAPDRVSVEIVHMGHHLGGKAASYVDAHGKKTEHGWHMVLGFYDRMRALMRRSGVEPERTLATMGGVSHPYESATGRIHTLRGAGGHMAVASGFLAYDGLNAEDRLHLGRVLTQAMAVAQSGEDLKKHDDVCFSTWAVERGLPPHITRTSLFRMFREAYFNFPEQISAYHVLQTFKHMSSSSRAEATVCRGPMSERIWDPIARSLERRGVTITPYTLVTDWIYDGRRITGVRVARPDADGHGYGAHSWTTSAIPIERGSERTLAGFDYVISTVPHAVFVTMNARDARMWESRYFRRMKNLRSAATVAMRVKTRRPVLPYGGPVFGFPAPLGIATNMTPYLDEHRDAGFTGSDVHFVGQEAGFEHWSDAQIATVTLEHIERAPTVGSFREAGIESIDLRRNKSDFERLLLCEPGVQQFRPGHETPFHNLVLAGDWVANDVDLICMEGAIASAETAAQAVLDRAGAS